jgi:hypothetical protein
MDTTNSFDHIENNSVSGRTRSGERRRVCRGECAGDAEGKRLWLGARKASRQLMGSGTSVQRFLYKEFAQAWKQAGR